MDTNITDQKIFMEYKKVAMSALLPLFPGMMVHDLSNTLDEVIMSDLKDTPVILDNNYKHKKMELTMVNLVNYIMEREPIMTAYGVLFKKHGEVKNPLADMLKEFMEQRDIHKGMMFQALDKGDMETYEKYNLFQLLDKIDANGAYGAMGQYSCLFYNIYVAASITSQGRSCIAAAGLMFEAFLANNVRFSSLDEIVTFIYNVKGERSERKYDDRMILDRPVTPKECFDTLFSHAGFMWVPNEEEMDFGWNLINTLDQSDLNRVYYKNNLYAFMNNSRSQLRMISLLEAMDEPYLDPREGKAPKKIVGLLDEFKDLLKEYVYYHHQFIDRLDRYSAMIRKACVITDTDSTIISLDAWYRYNLELIKDKKLKISQVKVDPIERYERDEFGDFKDMPSGITRIDADLDYDFYNDEIIEMERCINPVTIIPQDGVRYSIINILGYCLTDYINDYMLRYTKNSHSFAEDRDCLIYMKNEFLFKRILLKDGKKNYADIQELQEGHVLPGGKLDVKGLPMTKSNLNSKTQKQLKKILYEDILNVDKIDQLKVIKDIAIMEKQIYNSLRAGKKEYYKPVRVKSFRAYDDPFRIQGIKGAYIWNELATEGIPLFDLEERNVMDIIKVNINHKTASVIEEIYPEVYEKILTLLSNPVIKGDINAIGIPKDMEHTPDWITYFIDYNTIISDNCTHLPIDSIGISRGHNANNYTNIIQF